MSRSQSKEDNLTVDIDSSAVLAGLSSGMLTYCADENDKYLKCKTDNQEPDKCLREALDVRRCAFKLYLIFSSYIIYIYIF